MTAPHEALPRIPVELCCADDVFNLPLFEGYLIVDLRTAAEVAAQGGETIASAHRFGDAAALSLGGGGHSADAHMAACFEHMERDLLWPEQWRHVVVYGAAHPVAGSADGDDDGHAPTLVWQAAEALARALAAGAAAQPPHHRSSLFRRVESVWVLAGGYPAFRDRHPMLCGLRFEDLKAPPTLAAPPRVYLQNRHNNALPLESEALGFWRITHVVTDHAADETRDLRGITHLKCRTATSKDYSNDITPSLGPVGAFINAALEDEACTGVLVHVADQATSAALIASWLVCTGQRSSVEDAFDSIQHKLLRKIRESSLEAARQQIRDWLATDDACYEKHAARQKQLC